MNLKTRLSIFISVVAIFLVIVLYVLEFQWFQNSFDTKKLVVGSLLMGLAIGGFIGFAMQKYGRDWVDKAQIWMVCLVVPLLLMPLIGSITNRVFANQAQETKVVFWGEKAFITSRFGKLEAMSADTTGFYIFIVKDGAIQRLSWPASKFPNAQRGDTIELPVRKGLFGIELVDFSN